MVSREYARTYHFVGSAALEASPSGLRVIDGGLRSCGTRRVPSRRPRSLDVLSASRPVAPTPALDSSQVLAGMLSMTLVSALVLLAWVAQRLLG